MFLQCEKPEAFPDERSDVQSIVVVELASTIASLACSYLCTSVKMNARATLSSSHCLRIKTGP